MASESDIIAFKTRAWADPRMVEWYAKRVSENVAGARLINRVETSLISAQVQGVDVLDVGIGSGRASLPLLERGIRLAGIDSSQAMLDECWRRAQGRPIDLRIGDVAALPFPDASFDSVVSLNVLTHFPNWRDILSEWLRVLRPGGRLVCDVYSRDHLEAVAAVHGGAAEGLLASGEEPSRYNLRVRVAELAEFARDKGVALRAIQPYGGVLGGDQNFWLTGSWADGHVWERLKSWIAEDDRLYEFLAFLELEGFACLDSRCTGRFMLTLERSGDAAATTATLARQDALAGALRSGRLGDLSPFLNLPADDWRARLDAHLDHPPNRMALFHLLTAVSQAGWKIDLADLCAPRHAEVLERWLLARQMDLQIHALASGWHRAPEHAEDLVYRGVPLGPGLEYDATRALLAAALGRPGDANHV